MAFKIGDGVTWTSQAGSYTKTKTGKVFAIVPARRLPRDCVDFQGRRPPDIGTCSPRNEESYIVLAEDRPGRHKLYWPRTSHLKPVEVAKPRILVEISGGVLTGVSSEIDLEVCLLDWDNLREIGMTEEEKNLKSMNMRKGLHAVW